MRAKISRIVSQRYGSPDPCQNITDPQHWMLRFAYVLDPDRRECTEYRMGGRDQCGDPQVIIWLIVCSVVV
jgi:hypothetical protein